MAANSLILLLCLAGAAFAQQSRTSVHHHKVAEDAAGTAIARAEAAIDKQDYAAAETALKHAVELEPDNYRAWYDFGLIYSATNRAGDAIAAYRKSVAASPKLFEANYNLAILLARAGDPEAEKYFLAATESTPSADRDQNLAKAWNALGRLVVNGDAKKAMQAFQKASALQPRNERYHLEVADAAEKLNDLATAEHEYQAAAALNPNSAEAVAGLANLYGKNKRLPEAEAALRKYLALNPDHPDSARAHLQLGRTLAAQNKNEEAQAEFETALRLSPGELSVQRELALLYVENKQWAKAEPLFREASQKEPKDAELHHRLGTVLIEQRKFTDAQQELLLAVQLKPDYGAAYGDLAFAASENKNYALTIKALDARARYLADIPFTMFLRATAYDHLGARKEAAASYHQFLAAANGKFPEQEWQARHRLIAIEPKK